MSWFILCSAILVLFYASLSFNVSRMRLRQQRSPAVTDAELKRAVRAHGNAAEYIPLFVALFIYLHVTHAGAFLAVIAVLATVSRIVHAVGMLRTRSGTERNRLRFYGALGTYLCLFALGGALLFSAF